ncbi:hypothetical protein KR222_009222, partial [Zaprionus bogoriensis]
LQGIIMSSTTKQNETNTEELDVGNERFNPLRALYAADYRVTERMPKVLYQNLAAFESAFLKVGIWKLNKLQKCCKDFASQTARDKADDVPAKAEIGLVRRFETHQMAVPGTVQMKHRRNLYTHMASTEGPLAQLNKCFAASKQVSCKMRIRVYLRKEHGIGGNIEGDLEAYDKQWNLLLKNVVETWHRRKYKYGKQMISCNPALDECNERLSQLGLTVPIVNAKSLNRKNVELRREIPQLMIRGENIVLICFISHL